MSSGQLLYSYTGNFFLKLAIPELHYYMGAVVQFHDKSLGETAISTAELELVQGALVPCFTHRLTHAPPILLSKSIARAVSLVSVNKWMLLTD